MATTYTSATKNGSGVQPKYLHDGVTVVQSKFTLSAAFVINDVVKFMTIPANVYITGIRLDVPQLDTNGVPTITLDVGDAGNAARYISQSTIGQTGGIVSEGVAGTIGYTSTSPIVMQMKVHAAPATGATSGTCVLQVSYTADP